MMTILTNNENKALTAVLGKLHGVLTEDEDNDYDEHKLEMRGHFCLSTPCPCVHNFYHIKGVQCVFAHLVEPFLCGLV